MLRSMKVATIVGARPQFIKCALLSRQLRESAAEVLIHTGQHYDSNMSELFFRDLEIPEPDYNLGVGSGTHGEQSGEMLKQIEKVLLKEKPDYALVFGDTNSTLAGALAAGKLCIPVAHVEAGLRSFNRRMPEELNRVVTDHLSSLLFCPTETSVSNLAREGITQRVYLVGDVMYDALLSNARRAEEKSRILKQLRLQPKSYFLATVHRAENTDDPTAWRLLSTPLR
jgi:UDP-GlcNAc3NAcA epimerase